MANVCALCNEAVIRYTDEKYVRIGEPTEAALKCLVEKMGLVGASADGQVGAQRASYFGSIIKSRYKTEATLKFCRDRKSVLVPCKDNQTGDRILYVKGAAELLLNRCTSVMRPDGSLQALSPKDRESIAARITGMSVRPLRVLGMAIKTGMPPRNSCPRSS